MIRELLPGLTLMVLLGLIRGLNIGTRLLAVSWVSWKIWVTIWLPPGLAGATVTTLPSNLPSASGTILEMPDASTTVNPRRRKATRNWL